MAARTRKVRHDDFTRFYVYRLFDDTGTLYVGKGSGRRLSVQMRNKDLDGEMLAMFTREKDAYDFEIAKIAELSPVLNRHPGGNGCRVQRQREIKPAWVREMERIGTRAYAARFLLTRFYPFTASEVDILRRVAHG